MDWFTALLVYIVVWWTVIFCVLPWGNEVDPNKDAQTGPGAPINPRLKQKFIITTGIAFVVWALIVWSVSTELIDFRAISRHMIEEDNR